MASAVEQQSMTARDMTVGAAAVSQAATSTAGTIQQLQEVASLVADKASSLRG